ncbi:hypothetical protein [Phytohabitans houttuyneae]|uniref:Uncharacterized protein n=1 Tax=Phytohabitans houttuyneae TaxID=1076126 RepID=A0A6V8KKR5_9ACTN|nr:hypothetical protein [Phytohabitans houttuyneae]GFJ85772.1 hypothetical protein Phou_099520 [Phytohabitans houttuyneae]
MTGETALFVVVVGARFLVPLLIPRFPLPAVLAALVLDAADQSIFQAFGYDPPGYQGYDKAMDMYYLAIAYLSTMRNWASLPALQVAAFLYFYRLAGVVAFELTQWRGLLLIFPNTFEYFFIAYEVVRLRRNPARYGMRAWITVAAVIWIFVKLPQEYWIHIAQLDFTDTLAAYPWFGPLIAVALVAAALVVWFVIRPRLPAPDWRWRVAADPLPAGLATAAGRDRWIVAHGRFLSLATLEKVVLVGCLSVIYGRVLPDRQSTDGELFLGVAAFVCANAAISLWAARAGRGRDSILAAFGVRVLINVGLVVLADWLLGRGDGGLNLGNALFFILLLSLITLLDDRYRPIQEARTAGAGAAGAPGAPATVS